jgi:hypothetical protein
VSRAQGLADLIHELEDIPTAGRSAGSRVETLR